MVVRFRERCVLHILVLCMRCIEPLASRIVRSVSSLQRYRTGDPVHGRRQRHMGTRRLRDVSVILVGKIAADFTPTTHELVFCQA